MISNPQKETTMAVLTEDGQPVGRRTDGKPLTPAEREEPREVLKLSPDPQVGITADDVLREFP